MITGKDGLHEELAKLSILSFQEQDYGSKVLIILNDGNYSLKRNTTTVSATTAQAAAVADDPCVCEIRLKKKPSRQLGTLRNMAMDAVPANGVWVQWDDDDWRVRTCMRLQYEEMVRQQADIVFLQRQIHVDLLWNSTFKYEYGEWGIWGTLMVNTSHPSARGLRLPNVDKGEDLYYDYLREKLRAVVWNNPPEQYFRIIHGFNTWDRAHFKPELRFRHNTWCLRMFSCPPHVVRDSKRMFALYNEALANAYASQKLLPTRDTESKQQPQVQVQFQTP